MKYIAGPDGQKVYTRSRRTCRPSRALQADTSLYDPAHAQFLASCRPAKSRPPLAVGAAYWMR
jgi:hypothetical protein